MKIVIFTFCIKFYPKDLLDREFAYFSHIPLFFNILTHSHILCVLCIGVGM